MAWGDPAALNAEDIFTEMKRLAASAPGLLAAYVVVLAGLGIVVDYSESASGTNSGLNIAQTAFEYFLTIKVMTSGGLLPNGAQRGFWPYIGLSILSNIGIALGFVLLVIPGIILLMRWLPAYAFLFAEDAGVTGSLGRSWHATKPHFAALLVAAIAPILIYLIAIGLYIAADYVPDVPPIAFQALANLLIYAGTAAWTLLGIAAYSLVANTGEGITEVFA